MYDYNDFQDPLNNNLDDLFDFSGINNSKSSEVESPIMLKKSNRLYFYKCSFLNTLTAVLFETGAKSVPTKSQNPTICG